uniref:Uncharacterized protein n=1 Tax=Macrostomum lignano TaxID=282301 RepID=A0A1I8F4S5_9PLAT
MLDCSANDANVKFVDLQLAKAEESGLPSDYFCSIPSQAALDQMRNLRVKGDAVKQPDGARAREDFLVEDSAVWRRRPLHPALLVASYDKSRQVLPLYNEMLSALLNPVYRASKDRMCRGGSSAALQQRQQQSPCSPITSSTANSTVGSLTPNHSSLPSFGFGRGRGGSGGSGSNLLGSAAG